jgi:hypothetical protein
VRAESERLRTLADARARQAAEAAKADKASLVCARGLKAMYADEQRNVLDGYSTYNKELAAYYADYVSNLEALLSKAGLPVAAAR